MDDPDDAAAAPVQCAGLGRRLDAGHQEATGSMSSCTSWGSRAAIQALATPDLGIYGFPHFRFFQTFLSHGLIVTSAIYMTVVEGFRPTWKSMLRVFVWMNVYAVIVYFVNIYHRQQLPDDQPQAGTAQPAGPAASLAHLHRVHGADRDRLDAPALSSLCGKRLADQVFFEPR